VGSVAHCGFCYFPSFVEEFFMSKVDVKVIHAALVTTKKQNGTLSDFVRNVIAVDKDADSDGKLRSQLNSRLVGMRKKYPDKKNLFTLRHESKGRKGTDLTELIGELQGLEEEDGLD
jgi:hypothetical protein